MGQNTTVLGIVGVVVILVVLLSPTLFVAGQNLINDLFEGWSSFWSQYSGSSGQMGVGATIYFADGTTDEIKPSGGQFLPLTVTYNDKEIDSVQFKMMGYFEYTGTLTHVNFNGELNFNFGADSQVKTKALSKNMDQGDVGMPKSSAVTEYGSLYVTSQELQNAVPESGEYTGIAYGHGTLTLTFEDGTVESITDQTKETQFQYYVSTSGVISALSLWVAPLT